MNNLRAIFLIIGIIMVGVDAVMLLTGIMPGGLLLVAPVALIGASVYYTIIENRKPSKAETLKRETLLNKIRATWTPITVAVADCEVKSNTWYTEVGKSSSMGAGMSVSSQSAAIWDAAKNDDGRSPGYEATAQSVVVVKKQFEGNERTFVSHMIAKDATTISFMLHSGNGITIYVNPDNTAECLFDEFLD